MFISYSSCLFLNVFVAEPLSKSLAFDGNWDFHPQTDPSAIQTNILHSPPTKMTTPVSNQAPDVADTFHAAQYPAHPETFISMAATPPGLHTMMISPQGVMTSSQDVMASSTAAMLSTQNMLSSPRAMMTSSQEVIASTSGYSMSLSASRDMTSLQHVMTSESAHAMFASSQSMMMPSRTTGASIMAASSCTPVMTASHNLMNITNPDLIKSTLGCHEFNLPLNAAESTPMMSPSKSTPTGHPNYSLKALHTTAYLNPYHRPALQPTVTVATPHTEANRMPLRSPGRGKDDSMFRSSKD